MKIFFFTALILSFCKLLAVSQNSVPDNNSYSLAYSYYVNGHYDSCLTLVKTTLPNSPNNILKADFYSLQLKALLNKRKFKEALILKNVIVRDSIIFSDNQKSLATIYINLGEVYTWLNKTDSALLMTKKAEALLSINYDQQLMSFIHRNYGKIYLYTDLNKSEFHLKKAIALAKPTDPMVIDMYISYADFLIEGYQYEEGKKILDQGFKVLNKYFINNENKKISLLTEKAFYYFRIRELKKSINTFEKEIRPLLFKNKTPKNLFQQYYFYKLAAWSHKIDGNIKLAMNYHDKCYSLVNLIFPEGHQQYGEVYRFYAGLYEDLGQNSLAKGWKNKYKHNIQLQKEPFFVVKYIERKILDAISKEDYKNALQLTEKGTKIEVKLMKSAGIAPRMLYLKSIVLYRQGKLEAALNVLKHTLRIQKKYYGENSSRYIASYQLAIDILSSMGNNLLLDSLYSELIPLAMTSEWQKNFRAHHFFLNYAVYQHKKGNYKSAKEWILREVRRCLVDSSQFKNKFPKGSNIKDIGSTVKAYKLLGKLLIQQYYLEQRIELMKEAVEIFEFTADLKLKNPYEYQFQSDKLVSRRKNNIDWTVEECLVIYYRGLYRKTKEKKYLIRSFELTEQFKASVLLEKINTINNNIFAGIPESISGYEKKLREDIIYFQSQLRKVQLKNGKRDIEHLLLIRRKSYDSLIRVIGKDFSRYYELKNINNTLNLKDIQERLEPNEALLEYFSLEKVSFVYLVTKKTITLRQVLNEKLTNRVDSLQRSLSPEFFQYKPQEAYQMYVTSASKLYKEQVAPILDSIKGVQKLYIIPDGLLHSVPFELLLSSNSTLIEDNNYQKLPYLLKEYDISYAYSATILFKNKELQKTRNYNGQLLALAPSYTDILDDQNQMQALGKFRDGFTALKWNKNEVNNINRHFDGEVLTGVEATEKVFLDKSNNYGILHLAMHALVDEEDPMQSKLVFTPSQDTLHDDYLHNFELYNMNINAQMAVLSACNTGVGELYQGEGLMSLARAFTYAGCPSVVMSHWRVDDKATSIIMDHFYRHLADGKRKDEALRLAKLEYLENASPFAQHPFYWNNFVVMGDVSPIKRDFDWKYWAVGLSILILLAVSIMLVRTKRSS